MFKLSMISAAIAADKIPMEKPTVTTDDAGVHTVVCQVPAAAADIGWCGVTHNPTDPKGESKGMTGLKGVVFGMDKSDNLLTGTSMKFTSKASEKPTLEAYTEDFAFLTSLKIDENKKITAVLKKETKNLACACGPGSVEDMKVHTTKAWATIPVKDEPEVKCTGLEKAKCEDDEHKDKCEFKADKCEDKPEVKCKDLADKAKCDEHKGKCEFKADKCIDKFDCTTLEEKKCKEHEDKCIFKDKKCVKKSGAAALSVMMILAALF